MPRPSVRHRILAEPRAGTTVEEYEDAATVRDDAWPVCAAVADGATESAFAGAWAQTLVRRVGAARATAPGAFRAEVLEGREEWRATVADRAADRPWYVQAKAAEGTFATVLGLSVHGEERWRAVSVGDCCLFHLRDEETLRTWPYRSPDAFGNRPPLVPSRPDRPVPDPETAAGTWTTGDTFLLATDAVAEWLLRTDPIQAGGHDPNAFRAAVATARDEGTLRNDDATLLVLQLGGADSS